MEKQNNLIPGWLENWMASKGVTLWGAADITGFETPSDDTGNGFPRAVSWVVPMTPEIMAGIQQGPTQAYADEYAKVNQRINTLSTALSEEMRKRGFRSKPLAASERTDTVHFAGDFPHKTAATRAGLGWIGRHCQLITRPYGSWVRLGTVFTDMDLSCGPALERNHCGTCMRCVSACPAKALTGKAWAPGVAREALLNVEACDQWKKTHYAIYHNGRNCGICSSVCPYGLKTWRRENRV